MKIKNIKKWVKSEVNLRNVEENTTVEFGLDDVPMKLLRYLMLNKSIKVVVKGIIVDIALGKNHEDFDVVVLDFTFQS